MALTCSVPHAPDTVFFDTIYARKPVRALRTHYGSAVGTCGARPHRAYIRVGQQRRQVSIGWYCPSCGAFIRGDDPLQGVELEGHGSYAEMDDIVADYYRGH